MWWWLSVAIVLQPLEWDRLQVVRPNLGCPLTVSSLADPLGNATLWHPFEAHGSSSASSPASWTPALILWSPLAIGWDHASLAATFSTMALTPPSVDWVVDSGASYHTTSTAGTLSHSHSPLPSHPSSIIVGNDSILSVASLGDSILPGLFHLNDILVAPHISHNLFSVRRFTTYNSCSMEFDMFGLFVKDLATKTLLTQSDSSGPLYTL